MDIASILLKAIQSRQDISVKNAAMYNEMQKANMMNRYRGEALSQRGVMSPIEEALAKIKMANMESMIAGRERSGDVSEGKLALDEWYKQQRLNQIGQQSKVLKFPEGTLVPTPSQYDYETGEEMGNEMFNMPIGDVPQGYFGRNTKIAITPRSKKTTSSGTSIDKLRELLLR